MVKSTMAFPILLLATIVASGAGSARPAEAKPPLKAAILRQEHRNEYTRFEALVDALGISEGMTILDVGAGPGYASFLFAEKLRGSGQVFSTDIRADFVRHIADEAKRRGLNNLHPVLVDAEGLDPFYGTHRYDLVFLSNVYHCLENRIDYFRRMRGLLTKKARLVLVLYNQVPVFSTDDFSDADGLIDELSRETDDDPFLNRLSAGTRNLLKENPKGKGVARALVEDFNRMLVDPRFYKEFYRNSYFSKNLFSPDEREFANWLLMTLEEDGVLVQPADRIDEKAMRTVIKLNRMFFRKKFGGYLENDGMGAYIPAGDANRHTSKYAMLRELDAAGFRQATEITLSPYFDAVIMVPKTPASPR